MAKVKRNGTYKIDGKDFLCVKNNITVLNFFYRYTL